MSFFEENKNENFPHTSTHESFMCEASSYDAKLI